MKKFIYIIIYLLPLVGFSQGLQPGFSKKEYTELLKISAKQVDTTKVKMTIPAPENFKLIYRSSVLGLENRWDLWANNEQTAVLSIRGTTGDFISWLANFYAAMVPAKGSLQLEKNYKFNYELASDPKAAVHTGWLVATGMLVRDILPKIDSIYKAGTKNIIIMGHSQGGAIAYLLTSHLYNLRAKGILPADIVFKTYCSAAPKPGNLYYAYEYENTTAGGWAFNVVNASDWVPEMPVSVQTTNDYNSVNPFVNAVPAIKKQKFLQQILLMKVYRKLSGPPRKSEAEYRKYLGDKVYKLVKKQMPEFEKPIYFESINYVRTGTSVILLPDADYHTAFPDDINKIFMHHFFEPYFFLLERMKGD
ncbi:MAG TPA: lipase family protein [Bacteroidia bacterium]|nr:lipase family protein [Bacteroidia bacterium]